jgi:hypothetical protein
VRSANGWLIDYFVPSVLFCAFGTADIIGELKGKSKGQK